MKSLLFVSCFLCISLGSRSQSINVVSDTIRVILENDKMIVTEYASTPGKDICGKGKHSHAPHLTILLTDANVKLITAEGEMHAIDLKAGTTFWSEAETHTAYNNGNKPAKVYIVELK